MTTTTVLEAGFNDLMATLFDRTGHGTGKSGDRYWPYRWEQARKRRASGVAYAKELLAKKEPQEGFTRLADEGRLDLSVEWAVVNPHFEPLFSPQERQVAWDRLAVLLPDPFYGTNRTLDSELNAALAG